MRERVDQLIGGVVEGLWLGTFHGIANRILRRHAELVGLKQNFAILDDDDHLRLIKQIIEAEGLDEKQLPPRLLRGDRKSVVSGKRVSVRVGRGGCRIMKKKTLSEAQGGVP